MRNENIERHKRRKSEYILCGAYEERQREIDGRMEWSGIEEGGVCVDGECITPSHREQSAQNSTLAQSEQGPLETRSQEECRVQWEHCWMGWVGMQSDTDSAAFIVSLSFFLVDIITLVFAESSTGSVDIFLV